MKAALILLTALLAAPSLLFAERADPAGVGPSRGGAFGGARMHAPPVVIHMHRYSVPRPQPIRNPANIVHGEPMRTPPTRFENGQPITQPRAVHPPAHHAVVAHNPAIVAAIQRQQRSERQPGRFYWHTVNGVRFAHYYNHGVDWYGFYHGPRFYWCRRWGGRWWWYDPTAARWDYWFDGYWWWPGPNGLAYVYVDNNYYPYDEAEGGVTVQNPETPPPPSELPSGADQGSSYQSPSGQRLVQIFGPDSEAFLYNTAGGSPSFMRYLAANVSNVRFSGGKAGKPLHILLEFADDSFALFDQDGNPMDVPAAATAGALPAPPPPSAPPPTAAPPAQ